ncbi:MAG TPA: YceI family protein [Bacteroidia bacterium]|nr:YceI family protein [Bacteroidia bacterium]
MKKKSIIAFVILISITKGFAQTWSMDKTHSHVGFSVKYLTVANVVGSFVSFDAKVNTTKPDFSDASIEFSADVNSINTNEEGRDKYLKGADFFDAKQFGKIIFKSSSLKRIKNNEYSLSGSLTLHGITKPVVFILTYNGTTINEFNKKTVAGFKVTGTIKRTDFNLGADFPPPMLADEAQLDADLFLNKD